MGDTIEVAIDGEKRKAQHCDVSRACCGNRTSAFFACDWCH